MQETSSNSYEKYAQGGAIYSNGNLTIKDSTFTNNQSSNNGGALSIINSTTKIVDTDFINNNSKQGGAIYAGYTEVGDIVPFLEELGIELGTRITALNKDVKFSGNTAEKGGDIYIADGTLNLNANQGKEISFNDGIPYSMEEILKLSWKRYL